MNHTKNYKNKSQKNQLVWFESEIEKKWEKAGNYHVIPLILDKELKEGNFG